MVDWKFMHHVLTKSGLLAGQSRFCPCFLKFPWQPFGDLNWYAVYANFVIHVVLKIVFTLSSAYLVTKSFDSIKGQFRSTIGRCCIQIMSIFLSIWLPIRVLWPHLLFLTANFTKYVQDLIKYIPKEYRYRFRIKPCTDLAVAILYWFDTGLAAFGILLILVAFLVSKIWNRFRGGRDPSLARGISEAPMAKDEVSSSEPDSRMPGVASRRTSAPGNRVPGDGEPGGRRISDRARACWNWLKDRFRKPPGLLDRSEVPRRPGRPSLLAPRESNESFRTSSRGSTPPRRSNENPANALGGESPRGSTALLTPRESNERPASVWSWRGTPRWPRLFQRESNDNARSEPSPRRPTSRRASPPGRESNESPENVSRRASPRRPTGRRASPSGRESNENPENVSRRASPRRPTGRRASPSGRESNESPENVSRRASPRRPTGRRASQTERESDENSGNVPQVRTRTSSHPNPAAQGTRMPTDGSTPLLIRRKADRNQPDVVILRRSSRIRNSSSVEVLVPPGQRNSQNGYLLRATPGYTRYGVIFETDTNTGTT